jgi:hypothetical protein
MADAKPGTEQERTARDLVSSSQRAPLKKRNGFFIFSP